MQKSETIYWSIVAASATYLIVNFSFGLGTTIHARDSIQPVTVDESATRTMPMAMGCGMNGGGGCGCGAMMKTR